MTRKSVLTLVTTSAGTLSEHTATLVKFSTQTSAVRNTDRRRDAGCPSPHFLVSHSECVVPLLISHVGSRCRILHNVGVCLVANQGRREGQVVFSLVYVSVR